MPKWAALMVPDLHQTDQMTLYLLYSLSQMLRAVFSCGFPPPSALAAEMSNESIINALMNWSRGNALTLNMQCSK